MWCHLLLLLPLVGLALFLVLPWPLALSVTAALTVVALAVAVPGMRALRQPVRTGREALVGQIGKAASDIEREGLVRHGGELWTATANGQRISMGTPVRITGMDGVTLVVQPAQAAASGHDVPQDSE